MSISPGDQDQSIKDRRRLLYDDEELPSQGAKPSVESKPFVAHLRSTPAAPLGGGMKALLWGMGIVVALLFAASVWKSQNPTLRPGRGPANSGPRRRTSDNATTPAPQIVVVSPRIAWLNRG